MSLGLYTTNSPPNLRVLMDEVEGYVQGRDAILGSIKEFLKTGR